MAAFASADAALKASAASGGTDALHIGGPQEVVVGEPQAGLAKAENKPYFDSAGRTPYSWMNKNDFLALGSPSPPAYLPAVAGNHPWPFTRAAISKIDVTRVDAYVYAGRSFSWHSRAYFVLNSGFMSPNSSLISTAQAETGS